MILGRSAIGKYLIGAALLAAGCGVSMRLGATDTTSIATAQKPAVVAVEPATGANVTPSPGASVIVNVVGFQPPAKGSVQAVVTVQTGQGGNLNEIGRFGLFPNAAFSAGSAADAQQFRLNLDQATSSLVRQEGKVSVELVPFGGDGAGAQLKIGKVDLLPK